ncbi:alginate biosynthesis protein AlgP [Rhodococcus rhodochrous KG-21]|uniref:Alginate biosynthesis protein AlgP n=1 Tax=Rhodococcus rhodochrous KG-21 TaxID=1441923 RepID=A0A0M8PMQ7_RHORH|nr:alginate biosynthesis protein AlgP [Rhodococcus rhodochrous KG-21]
MSESRTKSGSGTGSELVCPPKESKGAGGYLKLAGQGATALARGPLVTGLFVARKGLDVARNMAGNRECRRAQAAATIESGSRGRGRKLLVTVGALGVVAAGGVVFYRSRLGDHPPVAPEPPRIESSPPAPVAAPEAAAPKAEAPKAEAPAPKPAATTNAKPAPAATPEAAAPKPEAAAPKPAAAAPAKPEPTATPEAVAPKPTPAPKPAPAADTAPKSTDAAPKGTADAAPTGKHAAKEEPARKPTPASKNAAAGGKGTSAKPQPPSGPAGGPKKQD